MRKRTTEPLRLASDADTWREMDATIEEAVDKICGQYDDQKLCESFLFIIDLLTNRDYDSNDRDCAAFHTQRAALPQ